MKTIPKWYYDEKQIGLDYLDPKIAGKYNDQHVKIFNFYGCETRFANIKNSEILKQKILLTS